MACSTVFDIFVKLRGNRGTYEKCAFSRFFFEKAVTAASSKSRPKVANMQCFSIAREFNSFKHQPEKSVQNSGGMERKNSVRKPRLRARYKNSSKIHRPRSKPPDPSFLIASSLWIAELEDIQGLNSKLLAELQQLSCLELDIYV